MRGMTLILVLGLLVTALYLAFALFGGWNHQTAGYTMVYWAAIIYTRTAVYMAAIWLLVFLSVLILWIVDALRQHPTPRIRGRWLLLAFAALSIACAAALPTFLVRLYHRDSVQQGNHVYHVALRMAFDGDNLYILYECDTAGLVCTSHAVSGSDANALAQAAVLRADAESNTIALEIDGELVATYPVQ